ncbi:MAG: GT4 family glycosyltransferase PelF [Bulleidia sp.]|nr:GT4 family glycosyltransferase PelF [Bulleidia sp.]
MRVCLILEGSYPYIHGGVSSWTDQLIRAMPDVEFVLLTIGPSRQKKGQFVYQLPENVKEVHECFLDEKQFLEPKRSYRFSFTEEESREILDMMRCEDPDWDVIIPAFRRQKYEPSAFLMSETFMNLFTTMMNESFPRAPFAGTFYMERSMLLPVMGLLGAKIPEADFYHPVCTGYAGLLAVIAGNVTGKPVCLTEHGIYSREREEELIRSSWTTSDYKEQWINFYYMLSSAIYKRAVCITSLFQNASEIQMELGAPAERCRVISNGIAYDRFCHIPLKKPDGFVDIGAPVRFAKIKDIKTMIYAFYEVTKSFPKARLHILGSDEDKQYADECRQLVRDLKLDNVIMPGQVDMIAYYEKLDITILTSLSEGQPLCTLESFAAGRPAVTTDVGCCRDLIFGARGDTFGQAGYIARPMDASDIAQKILQLITSPEKIRIFGENGKRRCEAFYQRPMMVSKYRQMYEEMEHGRNRI